MKTPPVILYACRDPFPIPHSALRPMVFTAWSAWHRLSIAVELLGLQRTYLARLIKQMEIK
jgi:hypothetical protein